MPYDANYQKPQRVFVLCMTALMAVAAMACGGENSQDTTAAESCPSTFNIVGTWKDTSLDPANAYTVYGADHTYQAHGYPLPPSAPQDAGHWELVPGSCACLSTPCQCAGCQVKLTTTVPDTPCTGATGTYTMTISSVDGGYLNRAVVTAGSDPDCPLRQETLLGYPDFSLE